MIALPRLRRRDGDIPRRIAIAHVHARHGRWDACERAVHHLQATHPDAIWALLYDACDRVIASLRHPVTGDTPLVTLVDDAGAGVLPARLILCRALNADELLRAEIAPLDAEGQRDAAVAVLRYAAHLAREVAR